MDIRKLVKLKEEIGVIIDDTGKELGVNNCNSDVSNEIKTIHESLQNTHMELHNSIKQIKKSI